MFVLNMPNILYQPVLTDLMFGEKELLSSSQCSGRLLADSYHLLQSRQAFSSLQAFKFTLFSVTDRDKNIHESLKYLKSYQKRRMNWQVDTEAANLSVKICPVYL